MVLFVPETAFRRSAHYNIDIASSTSQITLEPSPPTSPSANPDFPVDLVQAAAYREKDGLQEYAPAQRDGWLKRMPLFNGRKTDDSLWKLVLRPIVLVVHPAVFWGMLTQGASIGWTVMIGVVLAFIVSFPDIFTTDHSVPITTSFKSSSWATPRASRKCKSATCTQVPSSAPWPASSSSAPSPTGLSGG